MHPDPTAAGWTLGAVGAAAVAALCTAYALVLAIGLATLPSPAHPIQDPWFTAMELLILLIAPALVVFMAGLQAWVPAARRPAARLGLVFMAMCAALTSCVHFAVLVLSRQPAFAAAPWHDAVFAFTWPSLVYALDILAWDVFFALAAACAAAGLRGTALGGAVRWLLVASAVLAFAGLLGVPLADMRVRNLGIVGYALVFPLAAALALPALRRGPGAMP